MRSWACGITRTAYRDAAITIIPGMWYSIELQATTPVPEWNNQQVRSAQEEDVIIDATGKVRWAFGRQSTFHIVKSPLK